MNKISYLILILGLASACSTLLQTETSNTDFYKGDSYSPQAKVIEQYIEKTVSQQDYEIIRTQLEAEIIEWIDYYTNTRIFEEDDYEISNKLIFNHNKTEVVVLITVFFSHKNDGIVKMITGKKKHMNQWDFTLTGMNYYYAVKDERYTRYQMESKTFHKMALDGLVIKGKVQQKRIHELVNMWK